MALTRNNLLLALLAVASSAIAAQQKAPVTTLVWPAPPEQGRIAFVQTISGPGDLGLKASGFGRFANWLIGNDRPAENLVKPFAVALDEGDNLCVTDTGANAVCFFDAAKKKWFRWERVGKTRFASPVAVAKRGDTLFVADSSLASVIAFNTSGKMLSEIKQGLERPAGLTVAGDKLFVVDSQLNRVVVFDLRGKLLSQFGKRGAGEGEFNFPTHIAADPRGGLLVTDSMNARVQLFDAQGNFRGRIGSMGDSTGHFGRPKGAAEDSFGHVYVMDAVFDNMQIFDREGRLLLTLGEAGSERGEFWLPNGITITRDNRIYIADSYNRRIQVLKYIGGK